MRRLFYFAPVFIAVAGCQQTVAQHDAYCSSYTAPGSSEYAQCRNNLLLQQQAENQRRIQGMAMIAQGLNPPQPQFRQPLVCQTNYGTTICH